MSIQLRYCRPAQADGPGDKSDLPVIVELINAADAVDQLERGTTLDEFTREWSGPGKDPSRDLLLAMVSDVRSAGDGTVVGYTGLMHRAGPENHVFFCEGIVHPAWRRQGIGTQLLTHARRQAEDRTARLETDLPVYFQTGARESEADRRALFRKMGMRPVRYFLNLVRPLDTPARDSSSAVNEMIDERAGVSSLEDLPAPELPPGIQVRPFRPGVDDEVTLLTLNEAFQDHWNPIPTTADEWAHYLKNPKHRFDLWLLAWDGEECAGACLCEIDEDVNARTGRREGLVDELAVRRRWRRRGLGTALLVAGLHRLRERGMESAHLFTDAENLTGAVRLYHRVGFVERWRNTAYRLTIKPCRP